MRYNVDPMAGVLVVLGVAVMSCSCDSPTSPGSNPTPPQVDGHDVSITSAGVSPASVEIRVGERVVFSNDDTVDHQMSSDDHPLHLRCPEINQVGFLRPGETRETENFVEAETCGFHDHLDATNSALNGTITVTQ